MKNISDEKLDEFLESIFHESALSEETVEEIASSPQLLWNVRKSIAQQKPEPKKSWLFDLGWRLPAFSAVAMIFCFSLLLAWNFQKNEPVAELKAVEKSAPEQELNVKNIESPEPLTDIAKSVAPDEVENSKITASKIADTRVARKAAFADKKVRTATKAAAVEPEETVPEEIKTEFIALSYSSAADSGQILNVKVPRSMMVSLGVTSDVENISELVNAEVVLGDDGLARAIRFVR